MSAVDVYRVTAELDDPTLDVMIARLETRGRQPRFARMTHEYLDAMSEPRAREFVNTMMRRSEQGVFFGACNFYAYLAMRA